MGIESIYRRSTKAFVYLYDAVSKKLTKLDNEKLIEVMDATDPNIIDYKDFIESYRTGGGISLKYDYENLKKFYLELRSLLELGQAGLPIDKLVQPDNPNPKPALNFEKNGNFLRIKCSTFAVDKQENYSLNQKN